MRQCSSAHLQLTHTLPCLRGAKTLLGPHLDPLGMLVDMEKGSKESGIVALRNQLKRQTVLLSIFIGWFGGRKPDSIHVGI